ncbi:MAG: guanosine monophosphate reductase [bacterium]
MREGLTFDDVLIVPNHHSMVKSRQDPDVSVEFDETKRLVEPVIASPMDTVASPELLAELSTLGTFGIMHRYCSKADQLETLKRAEKLLVAGEELYAGIALGTKEDFDDEVFLCACERASVLCVDVANGDSVDSVDTVRNLRRVFPDKHIMAGNVATPQGFVRLADAGADSIRVGIGPGSACSTRTMTGIGVPQLTAIMWCREAADDWNVRLIADGGIRTPGDLSKAMAAGADLVMLGSIFAGAAESPSELVEDERGRLVKYYRGMASTAAQEARGASKAIVPEGVEGMVPYRGTCKDILTQFVGGLRSSMTYVNANDLDEYWMNTEFMKVSQAGVVESNPHDLI